MHKTVALDTEHNQHGGEEVNSYGLLRANEAREMNDIEQPPFFLIMSTRTNDETPAAA